MSWRIGFKSIRLNSTITSNSLLESVIKDAAASSGIKGTSKSKKIPIFTTGNLKSSPKKLTLLSRVIKGMSITQAETQMRMSIKKRGTDICAMLRRAQAALKHNYGENPSDYYIKQAWVGKGTYLKRVNIHGRGRFGRMTRPSAHVKVLLAKKEPNAFGMNDKQAEEFKKLKKMFKRDRLFVTTQDSRQVYNPRLPWDSKGYKYIMSPKWVESKNAFMRFRRT